MKNFPILVWDSGIGGLTTLFCLKRELLSEDFLYVADFANSPYGNKSKSQILSIVKKTVTWCLETYHPKMIVLACNTATAVCIDELRKTCGVPIVGCEPAVNLALKDGKKRVLVLCTSATKKYSFYLKNKSNITIFSPKNLAKLVDENILFNRQKIVKYLEKTLKKFCCKFDAVVLGCTHYALLKDEIEQILKCKAYEANAFVAKRANSILKEKGRGVGKVVLLSTAKEKQKLLMQVFDSIKLLEQKRRNKCAE